ncbi:MAG TPA: hypothetical protein H9748_01895 [Candidatus Mediterraneibacter norwichensis]|nr:hypothetical protein [Candidatus Mediterraneibacter norwichensis]
MREEVLRMEHIFCMEDGAVKLNYLSIQIFRGEIYGILCLESQGIDKLVELICWNRSLDNGQVFFEEKLVNSVQESRNTRNKVTVVGRHSRLIDGMTLADNLFVMREGFQKYVIPERAVQTETVNVLKKYGIQLSPKTLVKDLGNYDRLVLEVLKSVIAGDSLTILWEISDLLSAEELPRFHSLISRLAAHGSTFLYIYSHHEVLRPVCDRIAIFKESTIQKVLTVQSTVREQIQQVFARYCYEKFIKIRNDMEEKPRGPEVLRLFQVASGNIEELSFTIAKGENVLLLDQSNTILDDLTELLLGKEKPQRGRIFPVPSSGTRGKRIAVIQRNPVSSTLFPELSYLENLCFPLAEKIPCFWQRPKFQRSVLREYRDEIGPVIEAGNLYDLTQKELYTLVYYRYLISKPDVVVCVQPLSDLDMYLRIYVGELMGRLHKSGIAVLMLNTELYDSLYIADRLIQVKHGRIIGEYTRAEFDEIKLMQTVIFPD